MKSREWRARFCWVSLLGSVAFVPLGAAVAAPALGYCGFDLNTLSFRGTALEQAKCLLRPTRPAGKLGDALTTLPPPFEKVIDNDFKLDASRFRAYLVEQKIDPDSLGGKLDEPLSRSSTGDRPYARYFVIHDVSYNLCDNKAALAKSDDPSATWNTVMRWSNDGEAHLFITRDGKLISPQGRTFAVAHRATKLERDRLATKGLFLHVENVQLRTVDLKPEQSAMVLNKKTNKMECRNDRIAQTPGLTEIQYSRLALTYIGASHRAGQWLIPAYHLAVDDGIGDAHDDPQNFDLKSLGDQVCGHLKALGRDECAL